MWISIKPFLKTSRHIDRVADAVPTANSGLCFLGSGVPARSALRRVAVAHFLPCHPAHSADYLPTIYIRRTHSNLAGAHEISRRFGAMGAFNREHASLPHARWGKVGQRKQLHYGRDGW